MLQKKIQIGAKIKIRAKLQNFFIYRLISEIRSYKIGITSNPKPEC